MQLTSEEFFDNKISPFNPRNWTKIIYIAKLRNESVFSRFLPKFVKRYIASMEKIKKIKKGWEFDPYVDRERSRVYYDFKRGIVKDVYIKERDKKCTQ